MKDNASRRKFLKTSLAAAWTAGMGKSAVAAGGLNGSETLAAPSGAEPGYPASTRTPRKCVLLTMFPKGMSYKDRFKTAREVGFEGVQAPATPDPHVAEEIKKASEDAKIPIDSVMNMDHWKYPLSSSDPAVVEISMKGMQTALHNAKFWGADAVLLVPAVVNAKTSYRDAWIRSQKQIRKLIPLAQDLSVVIAIEEVWNKFLLSPLEFATYIDEFKSPWIKSWFDVGNVVLYGYPQDWIRTLGRRIAKVHLKDFKLKGNCYEWVNLGDGDVDWPAVRQAFAAVGYKGSYTVELKAGDAAYLRDVSARVDRLAFGV